MRSPVLALVAGAVCVGALAGQDPATPALKPGEGKPAAVLDYYLKKWEERNAKITGLVGSCKHTTIEDGKATVYVGELMALRPNYARLVLKLEADPANAKKWRHFAADGKDLWELDHHQKVARVHPLPEGGWSHPLFELLVGMKTADVQKRFDLSVDPDNDSKFGKHYLSIVLTPKAKEDGREFKKAELVLWKNDEDAQFKKYFMLPARLWFQSPNGDQLMWEFKGLTPKDLTEDDFAAPKLGADWKVERPKPPQATPGGSPKGR
jgi:TIGR03009 family protein